MQLRSATDRASPADEQAALRREASLRRIATLVAGGVTAEEFFAAVAREVSVVLDVPVVTVGRYELEGGSPVSVVLASREHASFPVGSRWPLDGAGTREIYENRRPIRIDDFSGLEGTLARAARQQGMSWVVGTPIVVDGAVWGNIYAGTTGDEPIPDDAGSRLADFTDLVSTAIANSDARDKVGRLLDEQAALRRVATLVAEGTSADELFALVTEEVGTLFDAEASIARFEPDGSAIVTVGLTTGIPVVTIGSRWELEDFLASTAVYRTGRPARDDRTHIQDASGAVADMLRATKFVSTVAAPIVVEGKLWGVLTVHDFRRTLPPDTEERVGQFTELVATAIANAASRGELAASEARARELAEEQAALRRVATLVARAPASEPPLSIVAREVASVLNVPGVIVQRYEADGAILTLGEAFGSDLADAKRFFAVGSRMPQDPGSLAAQVFATRRPARLDDFSTLPGTIGELARAAGLGSGCAGPIVVNGDLWGKMCVFSRRGTVLPAGTENRLHDFIELVATAIANYEARADLAASEARARELAEEHAALRNVATLVARGVRPPDIFSAVSEEVGRVFGSPYSGVGRFELDGSAVVIVGVSEGIRNIPIGTRWPLEDFLAVTAVYRTGRPARNERSGWEDDSGPVANSLRELGLVSTVAAPIVVEGNVWGAITVSDAHQRLPPDAEERLAAFTELVATAIANAESRAELAASEARARELAGEQAALRRVATLVARAPASERFFSAVAREVASVLNVPGVLVARFETDGTVDTVGAAYDSALSHAATFLGVGTRMPPDPGSLAAQVFRTHDAARVADYSTLPGSIGDAARAAGLGSGCAAPIVVNGDLWGQLAVFSRVGTVLPVGLENRLQDFIELVATAIANYEGRADLAASEARARELANEHAALRRVATLVAQGASPDELFSAVAREVAGIIDIPAVGVHRYEADGTFTILGIAGETGSFTVGSRWPVEDEGIAGMILATGRPARKDDYTSMPGLIGAAKRDDWMLSTVGVPIVVEGSIWGCLVAGAMFGKPIPADTEERLARFTELVATAVSNATTRTELLTSRARVVSAGDETRRRLERDLHDGIQQWLVALALRARKAAGLSAAGGSAVQELSGLADDLVAVTDELREIARGIHPAILSEAGLDQALAALARRSTIRVHLDVSFKGRYGPTLEATVYYVVAESITNAVKHAQASMVTVRGGRRNGVIELEIKDDGVGGADPRRGTGLLGLEDRVDTLGGTISFASPAGAGTTIRVKLPAGRRDAASAPSSG